jgi:hypothetical protein
VFEVGKTYVETDPYRAPELCKVFRPVWIGDVPDGIATLAMGFLTAAYPGTDWGVHLILLKSPENEITEEDFKKDWVEAVWDKSQKTHFWRPKSPDE